MWFIHSRDTWINRLDISRAADRAFHQTPEHYGRIVELVMRDTAAVLMQKTTNPPLRIDLSGPAGGSYRTGAGESVSEVRMDALEFNIFASGRWAFTEAQSRMEISGDIPAAEAALNKLLVLY